MTASSRWFFRFNTLLFVVPGLFSSHTATAADDNELIVSPSKAAPATVNADHTVEIHVRLRLPLTPPPGVQQPAANKGWRVTLSRTEWLDHEGNPSRVSYSYPVMRLRPLEKDIYKLTIEIAPWTPVGQYHLTVHGPGVEGRVPYGIEKGSSRFIMPETIHIRPDGTFDITLPPSTDSSDTSKLALVVAKSTPGLELYQDGRRIKPDTVVPAQLPDNGSRLAIYPLPSPKAAAGLSDHTTVQLKPVAPKPCELDIEWQPLLPNQVLEWRKLSIKTPSPPTNAVWQFGDGRYGEGSRVRHRFLLENTANISVTTYDDAARMCQENDTFTINPLRRHSGCSCTLIGR